jgi:hypothetical protein
METIQENPKVLLTNEEDIVIFQREDPIPLTLEMLRELLRKTGLTEIDQIVLLGTPLPTYSWVINFQKPVTLLTGFLPRMEVALAEVPDSLIQDLLSQNLGQPLKDPQNHLGSSRC